MDLVVEFCFALASKIVLTIGLHLILIVEIIRD